MTATLPLVSTDEAARQTGITRSAIDYWYRHGTITPTRPGTGQGSRPGWSPDEVAALAAIGRVRVDLIALGLSVPRSVIGALVGPARRDRRNC